MVELRVREPRRDVVVAMLRVDRALEGGFRVLCVRRSESRGGLPDGPGLEGKSGCVDLPEIVDRQLRHARAAVRAVLHQAERVELPNRLADGHRLMSSSTASAE